MKGTRRSAIYRQKAAGDTPHARRLEAPAISAREGWRPWLIAAALLVATLAAYQPVWNGGMLWDDDKHVTSPELRPVQALPRIWFDVGATQQYYPVVHSAFWIQHRLWGDATTGYHIVNIVLHVLSAGLLFLVLRQLAIPGALLAAAIFALHPVHVESVAWITELKNTLSGVFCLLAALAYLRYDRSRKASTYAISFGLFVLALLSKSVTATLSGSLLVVLWWQRGRLGWRRDVVPLVPFIVVGAASGLFTAWVERTHIGAAGPEFTLTLVERGLVAGRAIWFYLSKLVWPTDLVFIYPRWQVSQGEAWQYVYPLGVAALLATLWFLRKRSRAPLAALLIFAGTLFPVLGFFNVFPFRYSFVADHFQYLASIPIIALLAAGATLLGSSWKMRGEWVRIAAAVALAGVLGSLTWAQSHQYADGISLYRATLARNPSSWLVQGNLGGLLRESAPEEALVHLTEAIGLNPKSGEAHYNLANVLQQLNRFEEAVPHYHEAIQLLPGLALARYNLGNTLEQMNRLEEAERAYQDAIRVEPNLALAHNGLGRVLAAMGRLDEATREATEAVRLQPGLAVLHYDLAGILQSQFRWEEAIGQYQDALRLRPDASEVHNDLADALQQAGRFDEAAVHYDEAVRLSPELALVHTGRCRLLQAVGRLDEAAEECGTAVRLEPDLAVARYDLGNVLQRQGRLDEAVTHYVAAARLQPDVAEVHFNLGTALEGLRRMPQAREAFARARRLAPTEINALMVRGSALEAQGRLVEARQAYDEARRLEDSAETRQSLLRVDAALGRAAVAGRGGGGPR